MKVETLWKKKESQTHKHTGKAILRPTPEANGGEAYKTKIVTHKTNQSVNIERK